MAFAGLSRTIVGKRRIVRYSVPAMQIRGGRGDSMAERTQYFVLKEKAVPDVLLRVVKAKRLLDAGKVESVL